MPIFEITIPPSVRDKIKEQALYIAQDKPAVALRWYEEVYEHIQSLSEMPKRCPLAPESRYFDFEVRHLLMGNYRTLFYISENTVVILDFKGGRQNKPD